MLSAALLRSLRRFDDLSRIPGALGYEPARDQLPDGLPAPACRVVVVGRRGEFAWYGVEGSAALARRIARALAERGLCAAVLGFDAGARRLSLAAGAVRPLEVSLDAPDPLALARFNRTAAVADASALVTAFRIREAIEGLGVDERFFAGFRRALGSVLEPLPARIPIADRHGLALLLLTRILFLYFIEAKGWLAGRRRFLREEVDRCLGGGRSLQRHLLQPLFFGTLNRRPETRRTLARHFGPLPFLNGGLFEPHPLERRWKPSFPTPVLRDVFDALFEKFHFTLDTGSEDSVAPDMLGRVFEGVMEPEERHDSGTFYTPRALVDELLRDAVVTWLAARLGVGWSEAQQRMDFNEPGARRALGRIRLLDPAAGSGAFLLGALRLLAGPSDRTGGGYSGRLRRVLASSIYGVDRNAAAVRLAELRLWLEVVAADPDDRPESVQPLPNLDAMVRQGDTLHDVLPVGTSCVLPASMAARLTRLRHAVVITAGPEKVRTLRELRRAELAAARETLDQELARCTGAIAELLSLARGPTLFGDRRGLTAAERGSLAALRAARRRSRQRRRELHRADAVPWFSIGTQFADVMSRGGFDLVVGNPPWVRSESLAPETRRFLAQRFAWMRGRGGTSGYVHAPDLAVAFLERALELTAPQGVVAFLVPSKLATSGYAAAARAGLSRHTTIALAARLADHPAAVFDATVYPMGLVVTRTPPRPSHRVRVRLGTPPAPSDPPQASLGHAPWRLGAGPAMPVLERLDREHPRLAQRFVCQLGVKTGLNQVFLDPEPGVEPALLRWALRGRDVRPFRAEPVRRLLWPCDEQGRALSTLPSGAARFLAPHLADLRRRADFGRGPPWTLFRTRPACAAHRVVWADLGRRLEAVALSGPEGRPTIPLNTCYLAVVPDAETAHRLTAWLNSTWARGAARASADPASGGFARFNARVVAALPLPPAALTSPELLELGRAGAGSSLRQEDLDDCCADLLGLSARERAALAGLAGPAGAGR